MMKRSNAMKILLCILVVSTGLSLYFGWDRGRVGYQADLIASLDPDVMCDVRCGVCDNVFQMNLRDYTREIVQANKEGNFITCPQCSAPECLRVCEGGAVIPLPPGYPTWEPGDGSGNSKEELKPRASGLSGPTRGPSESESGGG